ncbi:hypothetical protein PbB2_02447 [Candidatus Phycosocius bacilliformis]|uniref:Protein CR006 P-loop domain-containing protein n=1 Tax=Candidatus Phycosocius bacilliformis TaxID=1445552 RepID=A0A2P2ECG7_9PROT|nr:AAA family ATPase [Candidatus Phycosocius bacilliformis]GBF58759.1 hypothetical protein PbB2_02447 [Candidatus Phycosocius bacilliformis]
MLTKITLNNAATFENGEVLDDLKRLNFIFGTNGTGKTTISRLLRDNTKFPDCELNWVDNIPINALVYNADFVEENFREDSDIQGVFTLGKDEGDEAEDLKRAIEESKIAKELAEKAKNSLEGDEQKAGLKTRKEKSIKTFVDLCWKEKDNFPKLRDGFQGSLNSKEAFKNTVLEKYNDRSKTKIFEQSELENEAASLFGDKPMELADFPPIDLSIIKSIEDEVIFQTPVLGSADTYLSSMISKLDNADWVRSGIHFHELSDDHCPFCQQQTDEAFKDALKNLFDETYEKAMNTIKEYGQRYRAEIEAIENLILRLPEFPTSIVDSQKFRDQLNSFVLSLKLNLEKIREKWKEPSKKVELYKSKEVADEIQNLSKSISEKVILHNKLVGDLKSKTEELKHKIWRLFIEKIKASIENFISEQSIFDSEIAEAEKIVKDENEKLEVRGRTIAEISARGTSIKPTMLAMNKLLEGFGFNSFKLALTAAEDGYQIERENGELACTSLSEGERTFIAFLYFYHLVMGANKPEEVVASRIIVIDDPVSSLDSDVLFIISSLLKKLFKMVFKKDGSIKQIFILTHNVYFHRNITSNLSYKPFIEEIKNDNKPKIKIVNIGFWVTKKADRVSTVCKYGAKNPITSGYELLWQEVRHAINSPGGGHVSASFQNTIRRILEHYFSFLGGKELTSLQKEFPDADEILFNSMISWANMGSHGAIDEVYIAPVHCELEVFLKTFRKVFETFGQEQHYEMMLGKS